MVGEGGSKRNAGAPHKAKNASRNSWDPGMPPGIIFEARLSDWLKMLSRIFYRK